MFFASYSGHQHTDLIFVCLSRIQNTAHFSAAQYHDTVGQLHQHIQILTYENHGNALFLLFIDQVIYSIRRINIQSTYHISRQQYGRCRRNLSSNENLLYITTGQSAYRSGDTRGYNLQIFYHISCKLFGRLSVRKRCMSLSEGT